MRGNVIARVHQCEEYLTGIFWLQIPEFNLADLGMGNNSEQILLDEFSEG